MRIRWSNTCSRAACVAGSALGPWWQTRPSAMTTSSSEFKAMLSSCSTLTTVRPSATSARTSCSQSAWCGGSRLARGSSISSTCASTASARASSTRWRSPPDNWPKARARQSQAWVARSARSTAWASFGDAAASQDWCGSRPSMATSHTVRSSPPDSPCPIQASRCARTRPGKVSAGSPKRRTSPSCGSNRASTLSSVDLPAPFGPTTLVQRARGRRSEMPCSTSAPPSAARMLRASSARSGAWRITARPAQNHAGASATTGNHRRARRSTRPPEAPAAQSASAPACRRPATAPRP